MAFVPGLSKKQVQKVITDYANIAPATMQLIDDLSAQINDPNDPASALIGRMAVAESDIDGSQAAISNLNSAVSGKQDVVSGISSSEIQALDGIQSNIQNQLNTKASTSSPTLSNPTLTGTVTLPDGSIANNKLQNSSISINGTPISLGGSATVVGQALPSQSGNSGKALVTDGSNLEWGLIDVSNLNNPVIKSDSVISRGTAIMDGTLASISINAQTRVGTILFTYPDWQNPATQKHEGFLSLANYTINYNPFDAIGSKIKLPGQWLSGVGSENPQGGFAESDYVYVDGLSVTYSYPFPVEVAFSIPEGLSCVSRQATALYGNIKVLSYYGQKTITNELSHLDGASSNIQTQINSIKTSGTLVDPSLKFTQAPVQLGTTLYVMSSDNVDLLLRTDDYSTSSKIKFTYPSAGYDWWQSLNSAEYSDYGSNYSMVDNNWFLKVTDGFGDKFYKIYDLSNMDPVIYLEKTDRDADLNDISGYISVWRYPQATVSATELVHLGGLSVNVQDTFDSLTVTPEIVKPTLVDPAMEFNNDLIFASGETDIGHSGYITAYPWENFYHISFWYPYIQTVCNNAYALIGAAVANGDTSYKLKIEYHTYDSATATYIPAETTLSITGFTSQSGGNYEMLTQDAASLATHSYLSYNNVTKLSVVQLADPVAFNSDQIKSKILGFDSATINTATPVSQLEAYLQDGGVAYYDLTAYSSPGGMQLYAFFSSTSPSLNDSMAVGKAATFVVMIKNGSSPQYISSIMGGVDPLGNVTWQGGSAPTSGNANATDVYTITALKTAANTFEVFADVAKFA